MDIGLQPRSVHVLKVTIFTIYFSKVFMLFFTLYISKGIYHGTYSNCFKQGANYLARSHS